MPAKVKPTNSPFFPFTVDEVTLGDLWFYPGHEKHGHNEGWEEARKSAPDDEQYIVRGELPSYCIYPEGTPTRYRGLPVPLYLLWTVFNRSRPKSLHYPDPGFPRFWSLCVNDVNRVELLLLVPVHHRTFGKGTITVTESDLDYLWGLQAAAPDLTVDRLHVYRGLIPARTKWIGATANRRRIVDRQYYLPVPEPFVTPTELEKQYLSFDPCFASVSPPRFNAFSLVYHEDGILLYLRHSYLDLSVPGKMPSFLPHMRGCTWMKWAPRTKSLRDLFVNRPLTRNKGHKLAAL